MFVTTNPKYKYDVPNKSGWNMLPSTFTQRGMNVLGLGKYDLHKFLFKYFKFKPDLIIVEWVPSSTIPIFFKKLGIVRCPIILNWGDYYAEMMTNYPRFLVKAMEDYAVKNVDYITTVSKRNEEIAKKYGKKVYYIPHGVFESKIKSKINLDSLKTKSKNLKVIYLGEQTKWKKVDQIIQAAQNANCDLFLFGETNHEFAELAKEHKNIHFMGYIPELEVQSVLKQADIFVSTSDQDCNYKFFEYIRVGKPILTYDGLPAKLFTHGEDAFLTRDFKKGLIELLTNDKLREKLERNVKKIKTFTWGEITDKYISLFEKIISKQI
jgi:glycosyltransferase involved in cell wall biosynthesis